MLQILHTFAALQLPVPTDSSTTEGTQAPGATPDEPVFDVFEAISNPQVWIDKALAVAPAVARAAAVLFFFMLVYRLMRPPIRRVLTRARMDSALIKLLVDSLLRWAVVIFAIVTAIGQLGVDVTAAIAGLGVAGLAVGLAAQETIANLIAGITLFIDKPFQVGDWITTDEEHGCVSEINLRTTHVRTRQNAFLIIPNRTIVDSTIKNHSMHGKLRVDVPVGVAYKEDIPAARQVMLAAVQQAPHIDAQRTDVVVAGLGDSAVDLELRIWVEHAENADFAAADCLERAKLALDAAGIQIPFPHMQLFVDTIEPAAADSMREVLAAGPG